ncbi:MAG: HNH endonuclease [Ferruginibacter sp.]
MAERKSISKKIRFEVFKRDKFKCGYCGATAPDVLLQIDHIDPVAAGGTNNILNLITACFDCNNGKSAKKLDDHTVVQKQRDQLEMLQERREQIEMMLQWQKDLSGVKDLLIDNLKEYWEDLAPGYSITETGMKTIKKYLREYSYEEIKEAMDISSDQ